MRKLFATPRPMLLALGIFVLFSLGSFAAVSLSVQSPEMHGNTGESRGRYMTVDNLADVEPGDVLAFFHADKGLYLIRVPVHFFITEGGAGKAWLDGGPEPKWKYAVDDDVSVDLVKWTRPALPPNPAPAKPSIDLVYFVEKGSQSDSDWKETKAGFFLAGFGFPYGPHALGGVGDGKLLAAGGVLAWGAYIAAAATILLLPVWLFLSRGAVTPKGSAKMPELLSLAQHAVVVVDRLRSSSWLVGFLLAAGGAGVLYSLNSEAEIIMVQPWRDWNNSLVFLGFLVWLAGLGAWMRHHREILRLRNAWKGLGTPEV